MKNERKVNISIILSVIALITVIGFIAIWCICVKDFSVVTENTFIGACTSLISLALPIIIGYQVINSIDIKHSLKESEDKFENYKKKVEEQITEFKNEVGKEVEKLKKTNSNLQQSLEIEKKERELLYQDTKVAMYHGKIKQNSALALSEQIDVIKLTIELGRTEEIKENIVLFVQILEYIHQANFYSIKSDNNKTVGLSSIGLFDSRQYEKEIKNKLRRLPQISDKFTEALILAEKAFDCKMDFIKKGSVGNIDDLETQIKEYINQIEEIYNTPLVAIG